MVFVNPNSTFRSWSGVTRVNSTSMATCAAAVLELLFPTEEPDPDVAGVEGDVADADELGLLPADADELGLLPAGADELGLLPALLPPDEVDRVAICALL
jgi:hypothetical protein